MILSPLSICKTITSKVPSQSLLKVLLTELVSASQALICKKSQGFFSTSKIYIPSKVQYQIAVVFPQACSNLSEMLI